MKKLDNYKISYNNVIFRADLNVPVVDKKITDYSRINSILPSLNELIKNNNKIFIIAHFGRPKGKINKKDSLQFLCEELKNKLNISRIHFLETFNTEFIKQKIDEMNDGEVCLFENIRFELGEEKNDLIFSKTLSSNFDIYVNDAFSASHRSHSSIVGIPKFLPAVAGLSLIKEIENLDYFLKNSKKPNLAIIGGSKISTKIKVVFNLINLFDTIVVGGAMANTFLLANNINIGESLVEEDFISTARDIQKKAKNKNCKIILPIDVVCAKNLNDINNVRIFSINSIFEEHMILDVGPKTINLISKEILKSQSILWNGPLGAFEYKPFDKSSINISNAIQKHANNFNIDALAGGGDTLAAINLANTKDGFSYLSNAGGAFLEWLEGDESPGIKALKSNNF
ncbi:phosphoglycerate kinase [Pelagibacteraceae bacterium]|nr:phosphoglycerate kinase [Pelagibacteraceae bacterium]